VISEKVLVAFEKFCKCFDAAHATMNMITTLKLSLFFKKLYPRGCS